MKNLLFAFLIIFTSIQLNAQIVGILDVLLSFAMISTLNNYSKPQLNDSYKIDIKEGRHPVIETQMPIG